MPACHAGGRGFESLPDRHLVLMFAEIALQTILAAIVGAVWLTPLVVSPAAKSSLDEEALKFFLKTSFFDFTSCCGDAVYLFKYCLFLSANRI